MCILICYFVKNYHVITSLRTSSFLYLPLPLFLNLSTLHLSMLKNKLLLNRYSFFFKAIMAIFKSSKFSHKITSSSAKRIAFTPGICLITSLMSLIERSNRKGDKHPPCRTSLDCTHFSRYCNPVNNLWKINV
jgi:hypothetical protein